MLSIPPAELGLSNDLLTDAIEPGSVYQRDGGDRRLTRTQEAVLSDQSDWRAVRRYLNHHRGALADLAARLYPASLRISRTGAMRFGLSTYFDKLDISEAIGHEIAELRSRRGRVTEGDLPFRSSCWNTSRWPRLERPAWR